MGLPEGYVLARAEEPPLGERQPGHVDRRSTVQEVHVSVRIVMQTQVCVPCGRGWPVERELTHAGGDEVPLTTCTRCGRPTEPRGIPWVRIPMGAGDGSVGDRR